MKILREENGQTLVLTALCMSVLIGFMGLAVDVGMLYRAQRNVQIAADAAAVAGALELNTNGSANVVTVAQAAATANGISNTNQVTVNIGPSYGYHLGSEYVEVIIQQPNPTIFMHTMSNIMRANNFGTVTVGARAVAGTVPAPNCMYALDGTADDSFDVQGSAVVNTPNCSVQINSNSQQAMCTTGSAKVNSVAIHIRGAQNPQGKCNGTQKNASTGGGYVPDPLAGKVPTPTCDSSNTVSASTINSSTTILSEVQTTGSGSNATTATVTCFSANNPTISGGTTLGTAGGNQVFVFENGVTIGGGGTVTVNGTIDNQGGSLTQGNSALTIAAPANTSDTYNGLAIWVPSTNTSNTCAGSYSSFKGTPAPGGCLQIQFGSGYGNLDGMIYAPAAAVYMQDNGGGNVVTAIIADELYDKSSNLEITNNYNYAHASTSPLNQVEMVE